MVNLIQSMIIPFFIMGLQTQIQGISLYERRVKSNERSQRQADTSPTIPPTICKNKTVIIKQTEYERGMTCTHTFKEKCHLTYITDYSSAPEKKCDTSYRKRCQIVFKPKSHNEKVQICHTPVKRVCDDDIEGPEICKDIKETVCETKFKKYEIEEDVPECKMVEKERCQNVTVEVLHLAHTDSQPIQVVKEKCEKWPIQECKLEKKLVTKVHPETSCKSIPREVCYPDNCKVEPGEEICNDENRVVVQNVPEEECDLEPEEQCQLKSSLVPRLVPKKNCIKVPKEFCVNTKRNPKQVDVPIMKEWCYNPHEFDALNEDK